MSLYNFVFGTDVNIDDHILQNLNNNTGTEYLLKCYGNLKQRSSPECNTYFNNYFNMFLSNDFWDINYRLIIDNLIKDPKLFDLILQSDNIHGIVDNILINSVNLEFYKLSALYKIIFKTDYVKEFIVESKIWIYDTGKANEKSILGMIVNAIVHDNNWQTDIEKLYKLFVIFLKNKTIKNNVVEWIATIINQNKKRRQVGSHNETFLDCSSYNFLMNLSALLYVFFKKGYKVDKKIDIKYLLDNNSGLEWLKNTKIPEQKYSFYEDCFFMSFRCFDLSVVSIYDTLDTLQKDIDHIKQLIETFGENDEEMSDAMKEYNIIRMSAVLDFKMKQLEENKSLMNNFILLGYYSEFVNYFTSWLSTVSMEILQEEHEGEKFNIDDILLSIIEGSIYLLSKEYRNYDISLIELGIKIIGGEYTNNPHIRCKYINFIANLFSKNIMQEFMSFSFVKESLLQNCVKLYNDIETFDDVSDKFTPRANIGYIIRYTCTVNVEYYRELEKVSDNDFMFKRFINMILNDLTYMLDMGLSKLKEISVKEKEITESKIDENDESAEEYARDCDMIKGSLSLSCDMLELVKFFSLDKISKKFKNMLLSTEIKTRFIEMLNHYLKKMVGKESKKLIVKNPEKYGFKPLLILTKLSNVYSCYFNEEEFIKTISCDKETYDPKLMDKMIRILSKKDCLKWETSGKLHHLSTQATKLYNEITEEEIEYEDVPEEFCDPILMSMIEEPIMIPGMDLIVEESVIKRHLLTNDENPFNRTPLTTQQLIDYNKQPDVIEKINEFKKQLNDWKKNYNKI